MFSENEDVLGFLDHCVLKICTFQFFCFGSEQLNQKTTIISSLLCLFKLS